MDEYLKGPSQLIDRSADPPTGWTIGSLLDWTARYLAEKKSECPRLDAEVLLAHALKCRRIELYVRYQEIASDQARKAFKELVRLRVEGCPVAYLVGRKEFFSLEFDIDQSVLIPRPESEFVVMECLRLAEELASPDVLDIGTGSGNIAVAVAHQHPGARVTAIDLRMESLKIAASNAVKHGTDGRIRFLAGDLFQPLSTDDRFDFILSNPPYIPTADLNRLPHGVRDFEPTIALDGGTEGYAVYDRLVEEGPKYFKPGGYLIVEIGAPQEKEARRRIQAHPGYKLAETVHDFSGHPRVLCARWTPA